MMLSGRNTDKIPLLFPAQPARKLACDPWSLSVLALTPGCELNAAAATNSPSMWPTVLSCRTLARTISPPSPLAVTKWMHWRLNFALSKAFYDRGPDAAPHKTPQAPRPRLPPPHRAGPLQPVFHDRRFSEKDQTSSCLSLPAILLPYGFCKVVRLHCHKRLADPTQARIDRQESLRWVKAAPPNRTLDFFENCVELTSFLLRRSPIRTRTAETVTPDERIAQSGAGQPMMVRDLSMAATGILGRAC
jgi:hypothetical protein